jgi:hypothetical protein
MARIIWDRPTNPPKWVADRLGISEWDLGIALHAIKQASGLGGADRVTISDDGTVTDDQGQAIGNIYDEL